MALNTKVQTDLETGEQTLVNAGFTQLYNQHWKTLRLLADEAPNALKVFTWIAELADNRNALVASYEAMSRELGIGVRTTYRAVAYLKEKQIIKVLKSGNMNIYVINDRIIWKDTADRKDKYSKFSAEVFIVGSEQEESYRRELVGHAVRKLSRRPKNKNRQDQISDFEKNKKSLA